VVVYHGESYPLVTIGEQCWFKKNLNAANYRSGDPITLLEDNAEWASTSSGAWSYPGNNLANGATYGKLYNFLAVSDSRGLCPTGWHVPSDEEWYILENFLGGSAVAGTALKSSPTDIPSWNGSNASGFSGLPAGNRYGSGGFNFLGSSGYWWSSSHYGGGPIYRYLNSGGSNVNRYNGYGLLGGFSVRCVRD
jgi:uncharacterized protein (TIGR02145 family)